MVSHNFLDAAPARPSRPLPPALLPRPPSTPLGSPLPPMAPRSRRGVGGGDARGRARACVSERAGRLGLGPAWLVAAILRQCWRRRHACGPSARSSPGSARGASRGPRSRGRRGGLAPPPRPRRPPQVRRRGAARRRCRGRGRRDERGGARAANNKPRRRRHKSGGAGAANRNRRGAHHLNVTGA